jgi:hypothetical protein
MAPITAPDPLARIANVAWDDGLLPLAEPTWTLEELRLHVRLGRPVVVLVHAQTLPGHAPDAATGDQPLLMIGTTPDGLIYSDPTFSSSLGYGLELSNADFTGLWDAATPPRQALAFRRAPLVGQAHLRQAEPPVPIPRKLPVPTPLPELPLIATPEPTPEPFIAELVSEEPPPQTAELDASSDYSWLVVLGAGVLALGASTIRRRRARSPH